MKNIIKISIAFLIFLVSCTTKNPVDDTFMKLDFSGKSPWTIEMTKGEGSVNWNPQTGIGASEYLCIQSEDTVDVQLYQTLSLKANQVYRLSADVKTEDVTGTYGASICLRNTWINSNLMKGTNDWERKTIVFLVPDSGRVDISCRLGAASGKAYFRDLVIEKLDYYTETSQYLIFRTDSNNVAGIRSETIREWLKNMDRVYEKYVELIGKKPYDGKKITILGVEQYPWGWAVAGNPIQWYARYIPSSLKDMEEKGDWSFGIMHEIGHDFNAGDGYAIKGCNENWNWNEEMFANFRMYYAVELLNGVFKMGDNIYRGEEGKYYYKTSYDKLFPEGNFTHDAHMYTLIRIKDKTGWEPFKKTFRWLYDNKTELDDGWAKFNLFLDKLTEYASFDVRTTYLAGELETVRKHLQK